MSGTGHDVRTAMARAAVLPFVVSMIAGGFGWTAELQVPAASPATPTMTESSTQGRRYHFNLTKGHGLPVCEAYLQRLNQTQFSYPPYCGRPESNVVPGFEYLDRRWMDKQDYDGLRIEVDSFLTNESPSTYYVHHRQADGSDVFGPPDSWRFPIAPAAWLYSDPVDIENNGKPDDVAIWTFEERDQIECGSPRGPQRAARQNGLVGYHFIRQNPSR